MSEAVTWAALGEEIARHGRVATITIIEISGSVPRGPGARMIVRPDGTMRGSIGGGALEWQASGFAAAALAAGACALHALRGEDLSGHWCGTEARVLIEPWDGASADLVRRLAEAEREGFALLSHIGPAKVERRVLSPSEADAYPAGRLVRLDAERFVERVNDARRPVFVFGAGHVGRAIVAALAPLPFRLTWIDARPDMFTPLPEDVETRLSQTPEGEVDNVPPGGFLIVTTHSHPADLAVVARALVREDLAYIGLIGSARKKARFLDALEAEGLGSPARTRLVCPIGLAGISGKEPAVIAASVAADLLLRHEAVGP